MNIDYSRENLTGMLLAHMTANKLSMVKIAEKYGVTKVALRSSMQSPLAHNRLLKDKYVELILTEVGLIHDGWQEEYAQYKAEWYAKGLHKNKQHEATYNGPRIDPEQWEQMKELSNQVCNALEVNNYCFAAVKATMLAQLMQGVK